MRRSWVRLGLPAAVAVAVVLFALGRGDVVVALLLGLIYILLFYMNILPSFLDDLGNINLAIGFVPLIFGLLLATRWT